MIKYNIGDICKCKKCIGIPCIVKIKDTYMRNNKYLNGVDVKYYTVDMCYAWGNYSKKYIYVPGYLDHSCCKNVFSCDLTLISTVELLGIL